MSVISNLGAHLTLYQLRNFSKYLVVTFILDSDHAMCGGVLRPKEKLIEMPILDHL